MFLFISSSVTFTTMTMYVAVKIYISVTIYTTVTMYTDVTVYTAGTIYTTVTISYNDNILSGNAYLSDNACIVKIYISVATYLFSTIFNLQKSGIVINSDHLYASDTICTLVTLYIFFFCSTKRGR